MLPQKLTMELILVCFVLVCFIHRHPDAYPDDTNNNASIGNLTNENLYTKIMKTKKC